MFDIRAVPLCGINITGIEDQIDLDSRMPEGFHQSYEDDRAAWWAGHGLEYYKDSNEPEPNNEFVGVSLETCAHEYRDYTFEDVRMLVFTALKQVPIKVRYKDVRWYLFTWLEVL